MVVDFVCPICKRAKMHWDGDEDSDDAGCEIKGILSFYHCEECGTQIEVLVPEKNEYKENE